MGAVHLADSAFALSEAKYQKWLHRKEIPERDRRLSEIKAQNLQAAGRAHEAFAIYEDFLARGQCKRVDFYKRVARAEGCPEMFTAASIKTFRQLIKATLENGSKDLHGRISRDLNSVGDLSPALRQALLDQRRYDQLQSRILDIVNAELGVLEAEGRLERNQQAFAGKPAAQPAAAIPVRGSARKRRKANPGILPQNGNVNKQQAAEALGLSTRSIERMSDLPTIKSAKGNRYKVTELRRILSERGVRQTPTK